LIEDLEENEASQEADYMAESESEVGEADLEIEAHVCNLKQPTNFLNFQAWIFFIKSGGANFHI
jgi:hypothetical protein